MDAAVDVVFVVGGQCRQHTQLDSAGVAVLWYRADDLDGALGGLSPVPGFDDLAEGSLSEEFQDLVCKPVSAVRVA